MESIILKKNRLITMINSNQDLSIILTELQKYILLVMERDISNISIQDRKELSEYIIDYITQAYQHGYFTDDNISLCLKKIINSSSSFYVITNPLIYGNCSSSQIGFNFKNSFSKSNMRHVIFHEITHSIANLYPNQDLGIKGVRIHNASKLKITNRSDNYIPIISEKMITFLNEIMAESTACDLAQSYKSLKTHVSCGVYSDWVVHYNRSYQDLGYSFLRTLLYDDSLSEREVFKQFTINSINNNQAICSCILKTYEKKNPNTWKEDLNRITTILGNLAYTHILEENDVIEARELMKKYLPKKNTIFISRADSNGSIHHKR